MFCHNKWNLFRQTFRQGGTMFDCFSWARKNAARESIMGSKYFWNFLVFWFNVISKKMEKWLYQGQVGIISDKLNISLVHPSELRTQNYNTLQMFCLLNPQMNACEPNPKTTSSNFNRWKSVTKIFCFHAISKDICLLF